MIGGIIVTGFAPSAIAHSDLELQIEAVNRQLASEGESAQLLLKRGDLYRRHLEFELAQQDFESARAIAPDEPLVDFFEGRLAQQTGSSERALELLDRYLNQRPDHAAAWVLHGKATLSDGRPAESAEDFGRAIALARKPSPELYRLQVLALVASNEIPAALEAVDAGLEEMPGEVNLIGLGADISVMAGDGDRAAEYLRILPTELQRVQRWNQLATRVACVSQEAGEDREACVKEAAGELDSQIDRLLSSVVNDSIQD